MRRLSGNIWPGILTLSVLLMGGWADAAAQGAGNQPKQSSQSSPAVQPSAKKKQASVLPPGDQAREDASYLIGPADVLAIHVWHEPEVSGKVQVRPDGKISLPLIGDLEASGYSPAKLQSAISEKLRTFLDDPEVTVVVEEVNSRKFNVLGEVEHAGSFPLVRPTRVLDAIAAAGGFRDFAKVRQIYVLRSAANGTTRVLPFNYKEVIQGRRVDQNVLLEAGDTIVVP